MIEKAIIFMLAVSLPLMLIVEQIACWRGGCEATSHQATKIARPRPPWKSDPVRRAIH
jgi:hypothetical protein